MLNSDAVTRELLHGSAERVSLDDGAGARAGSSGVRAIGLVGSARALTQARLTDGQLALALSAALFVVGAWPLALTKVPPYQDLPNHLATLTVIENLKAYPEYVFNGFFKTNAALFSWLFVTSKVLGVNLAARLFALFTLAANALVLPRFVLALTGSRKKMLVASLFAWPLVHHWFVSMGMLDFSVAVPLSLVLLLGLDRHRRIAAEGALSSRALASAAGLVVLELLTWYAHVFPLLVVHLLVLVEALRQPGWRARMATLRALALPLLPATLLALTSLTQQLRDAVGPMSSLGVNKFVAPWELVYNLWAECFWGYSNLSLSSLVPCIALGLVGLHAVAVSLRSRRPERSASYPAFFSPWAILALVVLYCFAPYKVTNWYHVNSRLIPYFWIGLLLYLPDSLPKWLIGVLGVSGLLYSAGQGIDYVRLDGERQEFTAGMEVVPEGARLLPMVFRQKGASSNTRNLLHMWGYYVVERRTSAPLLFAHSHSFPVTYREPPPVRFNHLVLEAFGPEATTPREVCRAASRFEECDSLFESTWKKFYADASPRFDHLLFWGATPEVLAMVPGDYHRAFERGRLVIYSRPAVTAAR
jgi:hypothetical protein